MGSPRFNSPLAHVVATQPLTCENAQEPRSFKGRGLCDSGTGGHGVDTGHVWTHQSQKGSTSSGMSHPSMRSFSRTRAATRSALLRSDSAGTTSA